MRLWECISLSKVKFIITVVVVSNKPTTYESTLSMEKVVMNENVNFLFL